LKPVLDHYAVGFRVMHGFTSATAVNDVAEDDDGRDLVVLYVGDFDPSGLYMSECDLPQRLADYGGDHVRLRRVALTKDQTEVPRVDGELVEWVTDLPSFPASDKRKDPRYPWFVKHHGNQCWEIDAMDPRDLRECVEREIKTLIEPVAWARCESVNKAELESLQTILSKWKG
jgi:hypothetical protein